ncbi:MAG: ECF transporter S component [Desulfurococcus sp.]|uniref:ECF transporter S component n=1 Tax=Desulfurococcus sp. TaxID=51678 RepID=UPI0031632F49
MDQAVKKYTIVDILLLGVIAAIYSVLFYVWWDVYYLIKAIGGPIVARLITYGLWFMPAPLAASLIRKPGSALLGEFLPALLESIIPTPGGLTNAIYGIAQGVFSEASYAAFIYRRYGLLQACLAGALPAVPAFILDALLFGDIYPVNEAVVVIAAIALSGALYGAVSYLAAKVVKG